MTLETIASGAWNYSSRSLLAGSDISVPLNQSQSLSKAIWQYATRTLTGGGVVSITGVFTCNISSLLPVTTDYAVDIESLQGLLTTYGYNISNEAQINNGQSVSIESLTQLNSSQSINTEILRGLITLYTVNFNSDTNHVLSHVFNEESIRVLGITHTLDEETLGMVVYNMFQNVESLLGIKVLGVVPIEATASYIFLNMGGTANIETIVGILRAANGHIESRYSLALSRHINIEAQQRIQNTYIKNISSLISISDTNNLNVECLGGYVILNIAQLLDIETTKDMVVSLVTDIETTLSIMKTTLVDVEALGSLYKPVVFNLESLRSLAKTSTLDAEIISSIAAVSVSSTFNLNSMQKISSVEAFDTESLTKRTVVGIIPINALKGVLYSANHNFEVDGIELEPSTVAGVIVADALIKSQNNDTTATFWGDGSVVIASTKSGLYIIPNKTTVITSSER